MRTLVLGGGVSGLTAALVLARGGRAGDQVQVLDAGTRPGGHAVTLRDGGFVVETGPHGFLRRDESGPVADLVRDLGIEDRLIEARAQARRRYVYLNGTLRRIPDSPPGLLMSDALSPFGKLRLLLEPWSPVPPAHEETVYEFARRRIGREAADAFIDPAVAGMSAGDSHRLSACAAFPAMVELERRYGSLIRGALSRRPRATPRLVSFDGGMGVMIDAIRARLGNAVHTRRTAQTASWRIHGWQVRCAGGELWEADRLVLAIPAWRAATLFRDFDPNLAGALDRIPSAPIDLVALAYREADLPKPLDGYGYLVSRREGLDTIGVVWESSVFAGRSPAGTVLLRVMLGGARNPAMARRSRDEVIERARAELDQVLGLSAPPVRTWVTRYPRAIAQYEVGHAGRVAWARELASRHPRLELVGTSFDGISLTAAIESAARLAEGGEPSVAVATGQWAREEATCRPAT